MAQKTTEERLASNEQSIQEIRKELQRFPVVEGALERLSEDVRGLHVLMGRMIRELPGVKGKNVEDSAEVGEFEAREKGEDPGEEEELDDWVFGETSKPGNGGGTNRIELRKLEMPTFTGENPESWIFRSEHFFQLQHLSEVEKLKAAVVSFEGDAIEWFRYSYNRRRIRTWGELRRRLLLRFRAQDEGSPCTRFLRVRQTGTVQDFRRRFEALSASLPHLTDEVLESTLINGLEEELRIEVLNARPRGVDELWEVAQLMENRLGRPTGPASRFEPSTNRGELKEREVDG